MARKITYRHNIMSIGSLESFLSIKGGYNGDRRDVYFVRALGCGPDTEYKIFAIDKKMAGEMRNKRLFYTRVKSLPRLTSRTDMDFYEKQFKAFQAKKEIFVQNQEGDGRFGSALSDACLEAADRYRHLKKNITESIEKNFIIKLLYWTDCVLGTSLAEWNERGCYKILAEDVQKEQEYLFYYMLTLIGCDVLLLEYRKDIETAADIGVDGIEFWQLYPFYNPMEQVIKSRNMQFPGKQELITLIQDATQFMYNHGYTQLTQYGFVHSEGEIILENAYYGKDGKNMDCLALGSGAFGSLGEWKYRNLFYRRYMESKGNRYLQLKHLSKYEMKMSGIVGFPKTLGISKDALERVNDNQPFKDTLQQLLNAEMLEEEERIYTLTRKGKCYIDNIYMALMSEEERKNILKTMKIHIIE